QARYGSHARLRKFEAGYLTPSGIYLSIGRFAVRPLEGFQDALAEANTRSAAVRDFLARVGCPADASTEDKRIILRDYVSSRRPFSTFLAENAVKLRDYGEKPFKSLLVG